MGRDRIRRGSPEAAQLEAVQRVRALELHNARVQRTILEHELLMALAAGGVAAHALWQARRRELVALGLMAADVVITPSAWTPQPPPAPYQEPLPPTPTAVEAARVAAELLAERPAMTREDHVALGVYIARLRALHQELGWEE
ncbi:hypothetical protein HNQ07_004500 [Deinococcus metalli]|uniref:Uncharacterized protein n=1 Tax=Deinococcus metalli TaxID=1141878 RepID=A0A7W8KJE0_9DEIO|nr:hypothetical protein [Deinococcus metalli]MBB5378990.1 hypothetical protein [Deinococcus metalli]GHF63533.1 hypothetical protein GCM10017781_44360 [Deinococcus metalli]